MRSERRPHARGVLRRRASPLMARLALLAVLALGVATLGALSGCGALSKDDETPTPFGPGSGVPPVDTAGAVALSVPDLDGTTVGTLSYDPGYFTPVPAPPPTAGNPLFATLANTADGVGLQLQLIFGRPDTPCRFQAALAARDLGFTILGDGARRINERQVVFDEVLLVGGSEHWRLDCARLVGNTGIEVLGISGPADRLGTPQVHFVLNSIHP